MENAVEALKIGAGVLLFVLALTVSISCFSQANRSVTAIVNMRDRDRQILYDQIEPSNSLTRVVGIETIIPTMYEAFDENIEIFFKDSSGDAIPIYYELDPYGRIKTNDDGSFKTVDYISSAGLSEERLDMILAVGKLNLSTYPNDEMKAKYEKQSYYDYGFYDFLTGKEFEEILGEYCEGDASSSPITKRVITYQEI